MSYVISYMTYWRFSLFPTFFSYSGIADQVDDPQERAASDSESDRSMDSIEARDFADQNPDLDDPDSNVQALRVEGPWNSASSQSFSFHKLGWGMAETKATQAVP